MINGILNVYKESGYTSHDVVARLRGILKERRIGHTGTLDPDAVGVLPVCVGKATKAISLMEDRDKSYRAVLRLGVETDTEDMSGRILCEKEVLSTEQEVYETVKSFQGVISQIPPMYSAKKVNGRRLYELAREGIVVERKPETVEIHEIDIEKIALPLVTFTVSCSAGTYIRSLCRDIGMKLGCGGCMESLVRTRAGRFSLSQAVPLEVIEEYKKADRMGELILPIDALFEEDPAYFAGQDLTRRLYNGNPLPLSYLSAGDGRGSADLAGSGRVRVYDHNGSFVGLYRPGEGDSLRPLRLFI